MDPSLGQKGADSKEGVYIFGMVKPVFQFGLMEDAKKIREEVFMQEQGFQDEFDDKEKERWNLVLYLDGVPISTGRLEEEDPETYWIQRIAVRKPYRGMKVGTYTVKFLCNKAISLGARKAILNAQLDKVPFYRSLGFREDPNGEVFLEEGLPHIKMTKVLVRPKKRR